METRTTAETTEEDTNTHFTTFRQGYMESAGVLVYSIAAVVGYGDSRGYAGKQRCALFSVECELKCGGTMACFFIFFGGNKTNHKHSLYVILLKKYRETPPPAYTPTPAPPCWLLT